MRVCDHPFDETLVGRRIKGYVGGTMIIIGIDPKNDNLVWVRHEQEGYDNGVYHHLFENEFIEKEN
jgi:hypothetical protein